MDGLFGAEAGVEGGREIEGKGPLKDDAPSVLEHLDR